MSASSRAAQRGLRPFASTTTARHGLRLPSNYLGRRQATEVTARLLLIPLRSISTERHTVGPPDGPPPGFNTEQAKKPLPKEETPASKKASESSAQNPEGAAAPQASQPSIQDASAESKTLTQLASQKDAEVKQKEEKQGKKLTLGQKIRHEIQHYWDGTKLLATEVKISTRLALKMAAGYELTRRENRQLQRTVQDLGRLVPFSVFVIVPFAEALLPIALRLFPNMLPSTYEGQSSKEKKAATLRATRKEVSSFLRQTMRETGLPLSPATTQKEEFSTFFRKLRATGEQPSTDDVIKVCRTFRDDLTLDNLSRPQLVSMCRYLNLNTFGTDTMLRYQVRHRMRQIKRDDRAISFEGVDSLNVSELQMACASRGIKTHGVSPARLREELQSWLDLRLKHGVPSTLLVLSNAYMYGQKADTDGFHSQIEALTGVLSSIPEELYHEIELEVHNAEGAATNRQRLDVLKEQQELIEEENEQNQENQETGLATPKDVEDIDEKEDRIAAASEQGAGADHQKVLGEAVDAEVDQVQAQEQQSAEKVAEAKKRET